MQTIYIDVLIVLNIYVNCFLLRITARLTASPLRNARCIAASVYGSLFSLLILAPEMPVFVSLLIKLGAAVTVVMAAFGVHGSMRLIKNTAAFFAANFILAGTVYAVYSMFRPSFMHFCNSYFYIDFSLLLLIISTAVFYFAVCLFRRITDRSRDDGYRVIVRFCGKVVTVDAIADTGNCLTDMFTGKSVIICGEDDLRLDAEGRLPAGYRLIPCSTVSDSGVIPVFRPDEVLIVNTVTGERKPADVLIGIGRNNGKAVFNPKNLF